MGIISGYFRKPEGSILYYAGSGFGQVLISLLFGLILFMIYRILLLLKKESRFFNRLDDFNKNNTIAEQIFMIALLVGSLIFAGVFV